MAKPVPSRNPAPDDVLRRMLNTPPKPHEAGKPKPAIPEGGNPKRPKKRS